MFANDVSILAQGVTKEDAAEKAQIAVEVVVRWSKEWKLYLNAIKSEAAFFTTSDTKAETSFDPNIIIDGKAIDFNSAPRLLGVYLDRSLCMYNHMDVVVERIRKMLKMLGAISNS